MPHIFFFYSDRVKKSSSKANKKKKKKSQSRWSRVTNMQIEFMWTHYYSFFRKETVYYVLSHNKGMLWSNHIAECSHSFLAPLSLKDNSVVTRFVNIRSECLFFLLTKLDTAGLCCHMNTINAAVLVHQTGTLFFRKP